MDSAIHLLNNWGQSQVKTMKLDEEGRLVGLKNHFKKSFVQRIDTKIQEKITIKGKDVADVEEFPYLECKVYRERAGMKNLRNRL